MWDGAQISFEAPVIHVNADTRRGKPAGTDFPPGPDGDAAVKPISGDILLV